MKILYPALCVLLLTVANAEAACCPDGGQSRAVQVRCCPDPDPYSFDTELQQGESLPGMTPYQSQMVYHGDWSNGCPCPLWTQGINYCCGQCMTGGSIDTPG